MDKEIKTIEYKMIEEIKNIRLSQRMTQEQFSELLGYSRDHYAKVESHNRKLTYYLMMAVIVKFNLGIDGLLIEKDKPLNDSNSDECIGKALDKSIVGDIGGKSCESIDERIAGLPCEVRKAAEKAIDGVLSAFESL